MRTVFLCALIAVIAGCASLYSGNMASIVQSTEDFTLDAVDSRAAVYEKSTLDAGDRAIAVEFGADSCFVADYVRDGSRYSVEVVSFSGPKGALGFFTASDPEGAFPVDVGEGGRKNDVMLQFVKGVVVATVSPRGGTMTGAESLARQLAGRIRTPGITVDIYGALPQKNRVDDSELFFMGRRIFAGRYSTELAEALNVTNIREGAAATYTVGDGEVEFVKIRYYSVQAAKEAINAYLKANADQPVVMPGDAARYYTVIHPDRSESYLVDYTEWVLFMPSVRSPKEGRELFEYFFRGGR